MKIVAGIKKIFTLRLLFGLLIGGTIGFAWYYFIGCNAGGCSITSNPYRITAFGMLFGALLLSK
jgi:hypothetical protein